jgi:hypothetical protein
MCRTLQKNIHVICRALGLDSDARKALQRNVTGTQLVAVPVSGCPFVGCRKILLDLDQDCSIIAEFRPIFPLHTRQLNTAGMDAP